MTNLDRAHDDVLVAEQEMATASLALRDAKLKLEAAVDKWMTAHAKYAELKCVRDLAGES